MIAVLFLTFRAQRGSPTRSMTRRAVRLMTIFYLIASSTPTIARGIESRAAPRCGVNQDQPPQRMFADPDGTQGWREFTKLADVPELGPDDGLFARLWEGTDGKVMVSIQEVGQDMAAYTDYCFDKAGHLAGIRYELRTAWGWGYREEGPVTKGALVRQTEEFFSTEDEKRIKKPDQASEVETAGWLRPHLYLQKSKLPFFKLISKQPT